MERTIKCLALNAIAFLVVIMVSCQKDAEFQTTSTDDFLDNNQPTQIYPVDNNLKVSSILNATSATQIPTQFFRSDQRYKTAYIHVKQYDGECSWTSYTLAAGAIANGDGETYTVNHEKITYVRNWCKSKYIEQLYAFATQKDNWIFTNVCLSKKVVSPAGRFLMIKDMLYHLETYKKPFVAIITSSGVGHYVVVWSIDWKCGGTGSTVYYTDSLDPVASTFDNQIKSMSLTSFLDKMGPNNPSVNTYCALFLR